MKKWIGITLLLAVLSVAVGAQAQGVGKYKRNDFFFFFAQVKSAEDELTDVRVGA